MNPTLPAGELPALPVPVAPTEPAGPPRAEPADDDPGLPGDRFALKLLLGCFVLVGLIGLANLILGLFSK